MLNGIIDAGINLEKNQIEKTPFLCVVVDHQAGCDWMKKPQNTDNGITDKQFLILPRHCAHTDG
jgi:hypothetical protein